MIMGKDHRMTYTQSILVSSTTPKTRLGISAQVDKQQVGRMYAREGTAHNGEDSYTSGYNNSCSHYYCC